MRWSPTTPAPSTPWRWTCKSCGCATAGSTGRSRATSPTSAPRPQRTRIGDPRSNATGKEQVLAIEVRLDAHHPLYAAHHQKLVCIDDRIAFVGGGDISTDRWDSEEHLDRDPRRALEPENAEAAMRRGARQIQALLWPYLSADLRQRLRALGANPDHESRVLRHWVQSLPIEGGKRLQVRGYLGVFYRTQHWVRVE